jgi:hypothetical protein
MIIGLPGDVIKLLLQGKGDGLDEKEPGYTHAYYYAYPT